MTDAAGRPLLLQLLGPPRLLAGAEVVHTGSRKALAIMALLALDGIGTRESLTALLWPQADSASGRRNLRRELFRLRELGAEVLESADGVLTLGSSVSTDIAGWTDAAPLPPIATQAMKGLDGVGSKEFDIWLQRWRARLVQQRAELLKRGADDAEGRGELGQALELQQQRWAADACDEAAGFEVIRLQAALGHRAGALQSYQRLSTTLREELDIAPSDATQALERSVRQSAAATDEALPSTQPPVRSSPGVPENVPFVARATVMQQIVAAWSRGQRVYLHGPAGTGKTRLACEVAAARGPWLRVACEPHDGGQPYASVVRLLRALRESAPDVALPDWVRRELAQLMPEWGEAAQALATDEARHRLLAAVTQAWRLLMHDNFSAVVLDDWHWGDPASVELWSRLDDADSPATSPHATGVAWIVSYRSAQLPDAALERQRSDIDNGRGVAIALKGLEPAEVLAMTRALSGATGGQLFSQRLHEATEGNPFFLLETLRHLFEQGLLVADAQGWSTPFDEKTRNYEELPVPPSVRAAVLARVRALGAPMQRLLEAASLGGGEIDARLLAGVTELDEEQVVAALEHARSAHLVRETATGWRFAHDLVNQSLVQGLSAGRRHLLHERLARQLELENAAPARVAAQWEAAQRPAAAVRWRVAAAEEALRVHALNEALASYAQALADGAHSAEAAAIHLACAGLHRRRADVVAADAEFNAAASAAASDALAGPLEVLKVQLARAEHLCMTDRIDEGLAALDALAPELVGAAPALRANALAVRATGLMRQGQFGKAGELMAQAEPLLEALPQSRRELAALLLNMTRCSNWSGDTAAWERHARRAVAVHESVDDIGGLASALSYLSLFHRSQGEREQAVAVGERARALAARCGNVPVHRNVNFLLLQTHLDAGETDRVLLLVDEGEALAPVYENLTVELNFIAARFYVHFMRGEVAAARSAGGRLLEMSKRARNRLARVGYLLMAADLYIDLDERETAQRLVDEAQAISDAHRAGGAASLFASNLAFKQATLTLAEARPAQALALIDPCVLDELGHRFNHAWIGAAAARALGDPAEARRRADAVSVDEAAPVQPLVCWLEQRLLLAADEGHADAAVAARARTLLAEHRVPVLRVERLRRALEAAPPG